MTSGLSRTRTSSGGRAAPPETGAPGHAARTSASSADSMATQRSGSAVAAARTAARRSASVLPTPSSVIRSFGTPARRATAHSPRDTTFAPKPRDGDLGDDRGDVVGLDRVLADPRVGERRRGSAAGGPVERRQVGDVDRRAGPRRGVAQRVGESRPRRPGGRGQPQSGTTSRTTVLTRLRTIAPMNAATIVSEREQVRREVADREVEARPRSRSRAVSSSRPALITNPNRPRVMNEIGSASSPHDRPDEAVDHAEDQRQDDDPDELAVVGDEVEAGGSGRTLVRT